MIKKLLAGLLGFTLLLSVAGCGGSTSTSESTASASSAAAGTASGTVSTGTTGGGSKALKLSELKIAMLLPSSPTDGGWGQVGAEALNYAKEKLGCEAVIVEAGTADLMKSEAEKLADDGYNIIFGHGGQYAAPFAEISSKYPDTLFITNGGSVVTNNQMPAEFVVEQLTYIEGAMAAKLSKSGVIGLVLGGDYPSYKKTSRGFELGAKSINPDIKVMLGVTKDASDMNEAYEITMSQINGGADIIWSNANQATLGSIKAAKEKNVKIFGVVSDAAKEAPDLVVASVVQNFNELCTGIAQKYIDGGLKSESIKIGVEEGGLRWAWNDAVKATLPADVVSMYDDLYGKIKSGEIKVPSENEGW